MRKWVLCALLMATAVVTPALAMPPLDPRGGAIFPEAKAKGLLNQCSRGVPGPVERTWAPSAAQIAELEARLPEALDGILARRGEYQNRSRDFLRQYGGFVVGGRKIIYVNAFPRFFAGTKRPLPDWHSEAKAVCDGGPAFFGVEYDPATRTFSNFQFNGIA